MACGKTHNTYVGNSGPRALYERVRGELRKGGRRKYRRERVQDRGVGIMDDRKIAIMIASDSIGKGAEELGKNLMKSYIYSLTEADVKPETIMFLNRGVYLTTKGSEVLDMIKQLERDGVEILSCGACLDYYGLNDDLVVGSVTNMYSNVEIMHDADNTIVIS